MYLGHVLFMYNVVSPSCCFLPGKYLRLRYRIHSRLQSMTIHSVFVVTGVSLALPRALRNNMLTLLPCAPEDCRLLSGLKSLPPLPPALSRKDKHQKRYPTGDDSAFTPMGFSGGRRPNLSLASLPLHLALFSTEAASHSHKYFLLPAANRKL